MWGRSCPPRGRRRVLAPGACEGDFLWKWGLCNYSRHSVSLYEFQEYGVAVRRLCNLRSDPRRLASQPPALCAPRAVLLAASPCRPSRPRDVPVTAGRTGPVAFFTRPPIWPPSFCSLCSKIFPRSLLHKPRAPPNHGRAGPRRPFARRASSRTLPVKAHARPVARGSWSLHFRSFVADARPFPVLTDQRLRSHLRSPAARLWAASPDRARFPPAFMERSVRPVSPARLSLCSLRELRAGPFRWSGWRT